MKKNIFSVIFVVTLMLAFSASASTLTIRPNAQGYYSAWTNSGCSSGASEWQCVDETPANTTDNLYINTKSVYESFAFQDTGFTNEVINSVTLYFYGQYYSSTRYQFRPLVRASSTNYLATVKSLTSSYALYSQTYATNPATGASWTIAQVNALEAGFGSYSANYGGRIAQMYAVVDYSIPNSCSETDGGNVITIAGNISGYFNQSFYWNADTCVDTESITEYYCNGTSQQSQLQSCGTDAYFGSNYCMSGDVYRNYTDYSCGSGKCSSSISAVLQQDCVAGQYCSNGVCLYSNSCSETDGGNVKTVFGNTSGYFNNSFYFSSDYCVDSSYVMEYYCNGTSKLNLQQSCGADGYSGSPFCLYSNVYRNYTDYYCGTGACSTNMTTRLYQTCSAGQVCRNGACLYSYSCYDSDGGFVPTIYANVTGYYNETYYASYDYCLDNSTVMEYYCSGNYSTSASANCIGNTTTVCSNGRCI